MARHQTPLNVLDITGRLKHDAKRYEGREPPPETDDPIGDAPELRAITFAEAWAAIIDMCPEGVLRRRDRGMVQEAARLHMTMHNLLVLQLMEGHLTPHVVSAESKLYQSYLARLGCSPTDCNHVHTAKKKPKGNEFDD